MDGPGPLSGSGGSGSVALYKGFLDKSSPSILKNFQRRWCVLAPDSFRYFKKQQDKQPAGIIFAAEIISIKKTQVKNFCFEVATRDRRYLFCATDEESFKGWDKAFQTFKPNAPTKLSNAAPPAAFPALVPAASKGLMRSSSSRLSSETGKGSAQSEGAVILSDLTSSSNGMLSTPPMQRSNSGGVTREKEKIFQANFTMEDMYMVDAETIHFVPNGTLGEGGFGVVKKAEWRGIEVAVKIMHRHCEVQEILDELAALCQIHHPRCVQLLGYTKSESGIWLITEFIKGGSLADLIKNKKVDLSLDLIVELAIGICQGMVYLHEQKNILHRDLKPGNILIEHFEPEVVVKIADFGISKKQSSLEKEKESEKVGTPYIMAPEVCSNNLYTPKSDVFSFGMLLWECFARQVPWHDVNFTFSYQILEYIAAGKRPSIDFKCPEEISKLIQSCWAQNAAERPTFSQILNILKKLRMTLPGARKSTGPTINLTQRSIVKKPIDEAGIKEFSGKIFNGFEQLEWTAFKCELKSTFLSEEDTLESFRCVFGQSHVKRSQFEHLLKWFFPILSDRSADDFLYRNVEQNEGAPAPEPVEPAVVEGFTLTHISSLLHSPWFHCFVSTDQAVSQLRKQASGCYLVRFSSSEPGSYALSVNDRGSVKHWKLYRENNRCYSIKGMRFPDVVAFVQYYRNHPLEGDADMAVTLDYPCPKKYSGALT